MSANGANLRPVTPEQVRDAIGWAVAEAAPLEIVSGGSKHALGRPTNADRRLDLSALRGIMLYEPAELVMSARPGTPLTEIEATLAAERQQLAFEPPDYGPLLGGAAGRATLGGTVAGNLSGPRRLLAGAARDHFLGFKAVSGRGEVFKSGGRVVKNVTGYDLCKLMCGSWGTLAAMTEITLKVLPAPETTRTLLVSGPGWAAAGVAMRQAVQAPHDVSAAAFLPADIAHGFSELRVAGAGGGVVALRIEGPSPSVDCRWAALREELRSFGAIDALDARDSVSFWRAVRDVLPFAEAGDSRCVWKLSVPPSEGPHIAETLVERVSAAAFLDWAGGLVWLALDGTDDAAHETVRAAIGATGGHATLIRAPEPLRVAVPVFHPLEPGVAALSRRVKESFDPRGILNPGRMYPAF